MKVKDCFVYTSTTPYKPSKRFLEGLYRIAEGRLRVRWSDMHDKWVLEEKITRCRIAFTHHIPQYILRRKGVKTVGVPNDSFIRARDGYFLVGYYDRETLYYPDWVLRDIARHDFRRYDGWKNVLQQVEDRERRAAESLDRRHQEERRFMSEEIYNSWTWQQGERVAVPQQYEHIAAAPDPGKNSHGN
jgi:hypothetical protein